MRKFFVILLLCLVSKYSFAQYDFVANDSIGCDSIDVTFTAISSASVDTISFIAWDFGNADLDTTYSILETVSTKYSFTGSYPVIMEINGVLGAVKPDYIKVFRTVKGNFTYKDTTEVTPYSIFFAHTPQPMEPSATYTFSWNFGDSQTGNGDTVIHDYATSGTYNVALTVSDNYGCNDTYTSPVTVANPIYDIIINASDTIGCDTVKVKFSMSNVDPDTLTSISWLAKAYNRPPVEFSNLADPDTVIFTPVRNPITGSFEPQTDISIFLVVDGDTANPIVKWNYIKIYRTVRAYFQCADTLTSSDNINKVCYGLDQNFDSTGGYRFIWNFEDIGVRTDPRPLVTYPAEFDTVQVRLTIADTIHNCFDTRRRRLLITPELLVQNVFTPNGDGINDFFEIQTNGNIPLNIKFYNRSGILVYQFEGTQIKWNGERVNGSKLPAGIYYYVIQPITGDVGGRYVKSGFVYLMRDIDDNIFDSR